MRPRARQCSVGHAARIVPGRTASDCTAAPWRSGCACIGYSAASWVRASASSVDTPISSNHDPEIMKKKFATIAAAAR